MLLNKRRLEREQLDRFIRVIDSQSGKLAGFLVDLSVDGVLLGSNSPLDMSGTAQFKLELPDDVPGGEDVTFQAQGVWGNQGENSIFYETGFRILDMPGDVRHRVEKLIASHRLVGSSL